MSLSAAPACSGPLGLAQRVLVARAQLGMQFLQFHCGDERVCVECVQHKCTVVCAFKGMVYEG